MKKFVSLFLIFSLLALSGNLIAKERRGAELIVQETDGTQVRGELIAVKENSLLLMERYSGADVSVDIKDVGVITIVKKSKILQGASIGAFVGFTCGAVYVLSTQSTQYWWNNRVTYATLYGVIGACIGALFGGIPGSIAGIDKTIQIEGESDSEIKEALEYLRKKARVRNFQ